MNYIKSPLHALCDEFGVKRIPVDSLNGTSCNDKSGTCVQYYGYPNTNEGGAVDVGSDLISEDSPIYKAKYSHTFIFAGK